MASDDADGRLAEQVAYYRARAPEYDDWWERRHEYDFGPVFDAAWAEEVAAVGAALDTFAPTGDVLELAAGTGIFTAQLLRHADRVTAVDASPEALAINTARNGTDRVDTVVADLFALGAAPALRPRVLHVLDLARPGVTLARLLGDGGAGARPGGPGLVLRQRPCGARRDPRPVPRGGLG